MVKNIALGMVILAMVSCKEHKPVQEVPPVASHYSEQFRPQFHFSPEEKWMNDPNGLVYNDGVYHLFYQYYPDDIVWGPMHWGHATSTDMVHWQHRPVALYPDEHGLIFSGSAVVDKNNTSGFAKNGETPLVAIFTYHLMEGEKEGRLDFQTQGIAYSLDNGDTWTKYEGNPVISNPGIKDFRDPKVFWHDASQQWILTLVAGDHAKFYASKDLKEWTFLSDFGKEKGAHGGVWECPDLFPLKVDGKDEEKWVLIISMNPGAPNGGSGTQYFIGDFDGTSFTSTQIEPKWLDYGTDNYAGVTYNNVPNGDRIFIGWMSNWDYAMDTPTKKWRSAMTVPRKLALHRVNDDYFLAGQPIERLNDLADSVLVGEKVIGPNNIENLNIEGLNQSMLKVRTAAKDFKIVFKNGLGEKLVLALDSKSGSLVLDRRHSGKVDFKESFGNKVHRAPLSWVGEEEKEMEILLDWSSIEVFMNGGLISMTDQVFPTQPYNVLVVENDDDTSNVTIEFVKHMESIWK